MGSGEMHGIANKAKCQLQLLADGHDQCRRLLNKPNWQFKSCNIPMIGLCIPIYFTACVVINDVALYMSSFKNDWTLLQSVVED